MDKNLKIKSNQLDILLDIKKSKSMINNLIQRSSLDIIDDDLRDLLSSLDIIDDLNSDNLKYSYNSIDKIFMDLISIKDFNDLLNDQRYDDHFDRSLNLIDYLSDQVNQELNKIFDYLDDYLKFRY